MTAIAASFTEQDGVPLIMAETACNGDAQRLTLRQDRFVIAPARAAAAAAAQLANPGCRRAAGAAQSAEVVLLQGSAEIRGRILRRGRSRSISATSAITGSSTAPTAGPRLTKSLPRMAPEDRVNFIADSWAMVQAGRAEPPSYLALVEAIDAGDHRAVWDQVITVFSTLNRLARDRAERPAVQRYARARLRPVFDRLGWDGSGSGDDDDTLLRASLIWTLGDFGDEDIFAEAKRRFAGFLQDPKSLPSALRDAVTHLVGVTADRATYDTLLALARKSTVTNERVRYYFAAASARDAGAGTRHAGADPDR